MTTILGIESSCDDSAAALLHAQRGVIAHAHRQQADLHESYGGVVPELAARDHTAALLPIVEEVLGGDRPSAVACTVGPGLAGCLTAGVGLAQSLAYGWDVPLVQVNHLEGHLLSPFLDRQEGFDFPYLCLLVSGGHTALYDVAELGSYRLLGATLDDAAGEAFDKTGILLGLGFPGGPQLETLARGGDPVAARLSPALRRRPGCDMSFSGVKTAARRALAAGHAPADVAAGFQAAAVATLAAKTERALMITGRGRLAVVGGVGRNAALRGALTHTAQESGAELFAPPAHWCTDNAAMIAYAGLSRLEESEGRSSCGYSVRIRPRWPVADIP